jgi:hypothetical protein
MHRDGSSQLWRSPTTTLWHIDAWERGPSTNQELCTSWGESVIASPYAKASGLKTLFKPRETCFLIGTKSVNLGFRPSKLPYGTSFARGKTGTTLPKRSNLGHLKNVG